MAQERAQEQARENMLRQQQEEERIRDVQQRLEELEVAARQRDNRQADVGDIMEVLQNNQGGSKIKAPSFDGKQDIDKFLDVFDEVRRLNRWSDETAALQLKLALKGRTGESIQGRTYGEVRDYLTTRYQLTEDEARRELRTAKLKKGENIYDYGDYILRMTQIAHPTLARQDREELAIKQMIDIIGDWVLRREFRNNAPRDYPAALKRIQEFVSDKGEKSSFRRLQTDTTDSEEDSEIATIKADAIKLNNKLDNEISKLQTKMDENQKTLLEAIGKSRTTTGSGTGKETRACFYCKKIGHLSNDCYKKKRDEQAASKAQTAGNASGLVA